MKLSNDDVRVIRQIVSTDYTLGLLKLLAKEFGCSAGYIGRLIAGRYRA